MIESIEPNLVGVRSRDGIWGICTGFRDKKGAAIGYGDILRFSYPHGLIKEYVVMLGENWLYSRETDGYGKDLFVNRKCVMFYLLNNDEKTFFDTYVPNGDLLDIPFSIPFAERAANYFDKINDYQHILREFTFNQHRIIEL